MSKSNKLLIAMLSLVLVVVASIMLVAAMASDEEEIAERQREAIERAELLMQYGIYDDAISYFHYAMNLTPGSNPNILINIARAHRSLFGLYFYDWDLWQYRSTIQLILDGGVPPDGMSLADVYYYYAIPHDQSNRREQDFIQLLEHSWHRTGDYRLFRMFEEYRYSWSSGRGIFGYATTIFNGAGQVMCLEKLYWGFVDSGGRLSIHPEFELATNFADEYAVIQRDGVLQFVDVDGRRRVASMDISASDIRYFDGNQFALSIRGHTGFFDGVRDDFRIIVGSEEGEHGTVFTNYEYTGMFSEDIRALKRNNRWALSHRYNTEMSTGFIFDGIALDEFGRASVGNRVFVIENNRFHLMAFNTESYEWERIGDSFEEARPFFEPGGLAAVRRGSMWGFIDTDGEIVVPLMYHDARSSSFNFAPVMAPDEFGDLFWGYVTLEHYPEPWEHYFGRLVIEPQFLNAKQFVDGVAPVETENGWMYIFLLAFD